MNATLIDARAAASRLGVSRATLYAYVSRGRLSARPHPTDPRARLYLAEEVEALSRSKHLRHRPQEVAGTALNWGMPAIETTISAIEDGSFYYRGADAVALAETEDLEGIAALLWQADTLHEAEFDPQSVPGWIETAARLKSASGLERAMALMPLAATGEPVGQTRTSLGAQAGWLVSALTEAAAPDRKVGLSIHERLARSWKAKGDYDVLRRALVLVADHEMNASTFATRVTASTGAKLSACLIAGMTALSGPLHGGATARVAALINEAEAMGPDEAVQSRLSRGDALPGFGHRLYPHGDPRATALLDYIGEPLITGVIAAADRDAGLLPTIDVALVGIERALGLPAGAAFDIFLIGRSVGWLAHAMEQRLTGQLIRPRSRYVGALPAGY